MLIIIFAALKLHFPSSFTVTRRHTVVNHTLSFTADIRPVWTVLSNGRNRHEIVHELYHIFTFIGYQQSDGRLSSPSFAVRG